MALIQGLNMRIKVDTKEIFHEVDANLSMSTDFKEVASKDTAGKLVTPGAQSWSLSCNALLENDGTTKEDLKTLSDKWKAKSVHAVTFTTGTSGDVIYSGNAYIESVEVSSPNEEGVNVSYNLRGDGDLTIAAVV